ncbi:MAG: outer membrane lipoprotein carrier protein LolA [Candidatus Electrothrix sp. AR4]|nr:outer membrane lipoprotein carrier protein LolA [Candidatus Electrothrix sp. AR4]
MGKQIVHTIIPLLLFACLTVIIPETWAANPPVPLQKLKKIQNIYRGLTSLSFDFHQTTRGNGRSRKGAGNSIFYRPASDIPGIMRWDYTKPDTQIILNDGKELSIYTRKDNQLIIMSADKLQSDITYSFFAGKRNLLDDFNPLPIEARFTEKSDQQDLLAVRLIPKQPHGQIKSLHFWFDNKSMIRKLIMEDHFETITELTFSNITFNTLPKNSEKIAAELVQLNLPSNTEIIKR